MSRLLLLFFVSFIAITISTTENTASKTPYLKRYSPVTYNVTHLKAFHNRMRRSVVSTNEEAERVQISFESNGRKFDLDVAPTTHDLFDEKNVIMGSLSQQNKKVDMSSFKMYKGYLHDEPKTSRVFGSIIDGIFVGKIESKEHGSYFIESSKRYEETESENAHAVIYHESDINDGDDLRQAKSELLERVKRVNDDDEISLNGGCGLTNRVNREKVEAHQKRAFEENKKKLKTASQFSSKRPSFSHFVNKYSREANTDTVNRRAKRQSNLVKAFPDNKSVCTLYLRIDPLMYETIFNAEGNRDIEVTRNFLVAYLVQQVDSLNAIFSATQFYSDSSRTSYYTGLTFKATKIVIIDIAQCTGTGTTLTATEQSLCSRNQDPVTFLNNVSDEDYSAYCDAFTFTSRDYADGTLGLAWLRTPNATLGGFCEKRVAVNGVQKSLNAGMVTITNFNARVPDRSQQITFAHEMGHNFGSSHDLTGDSQCAPGGASGNYIMYSRATSGLAPNNNLFSRCSQELIGINLEYVVTDTGRNCLKTVAETSGPICGNGVVDAGEQCDPSVIAGDVCCTSTCQLAINPVSNVPFVCSPSQGPCCSMQCSFRPSTDICSPSSDCTASVTCTGGTSVCPSTAQTNALAADNTLCNQDTQTCQNGECSGSLCSFVGGGLTECSLGSDLATEQAVLCATACTGPATNNVCLSISQIAGFGGRNVTLRPGTPCGGLQGYCDMFGACREVNQDAVFGKLVSSLLTAPSLSVSDLATFARDYWYVLVIIGICFAIFNVLVIACVTRSMKSDNPERRLANLQKRRTKTFKRPPVGRNQSNYMRKQSVESTARSTGRSSTRFGQDNGSYVTDEYRGGGGQQSQEMSSRSSRSNRSGRGLRASSRNRTVPEQSLVTQQQQQQQLGQQHHDINSETQNHIRINANQDSYDI